jgi:RNA polymerase sigma factor (sigma-70 family)
MLASCQKHFNANKICQIVTIFIFLRQKTEMMLLEELQIIKRVQKGDANAFALLVTKYQDVVFSIALKVLKNREEAKEIAQDSFIKAYRSIRSFQGKSKFSTWLFSITYNSCISQVRKKKYMTTNIDQIQENDEEVGGNFGEFQEEGRLRHLEMALEQLSEDDHMLIILYYYEEQSIDDICQVTGLNESNVKVKLHRARKKLYQMMDELMKKEVYS